MRPHRYTYKVIGRNWLGFKKVVLTFRTALNLNAIPGLIPRIKETFGATQIVGGL